MAVRRANIIILFSLAILLTGIYLTNKGKDRAVDGRQIRKCGKILTWAGAIILLATLALAYKVVPRTA